MTLLFFNFVYGRLDFVILWIFAIVGGAFMPRYQGAIIDGAGMTIAGQALESVRLSFFLPLSCFGVIAIFGFAVALCSPRPVAES